MSQSDFPLRRIDHVRFFVGNARQSAYFYRNAFGFDVIAYTGLETKSKHEAGYVLRQGNITFVRPGKLGDKLVATAREISRSGRSGIYDVRVTAGETIIAEFRGHSRTIPGTWLPVADTEKK